MTRVRQERDRMAERLESLTKNLQTIDAYLDAVTKWLTAAAVLMKPGHDGGFSVSAGG